jgi:LAGLIDADG endonuclease
MHSAICWKTRVSVRYSSYSVSVDSDNPDGAENQQERLIRIGWVVGFVDGEGCFSVSFVRQQDRTGRRGYKLGYQVAPRFIVSQGISSAVCLEELSEFFGVGRVYGNARHDNHREHMCQYIVNDRWDLLETIVPFFEEHPLRTAKRMDFEKFVTVLDMMEDDLHLTREGLAKIAEITQTMNRRKSRSELIRILRGHTPDIQDTG